jgi:hypothetical protein
MRLSIPEIRRAYDSIPIPEEPWRFARKHFRIELLNGVFVKLNRFENRLNVWALRRYLRKYALWHAFISVTDYLFPERFGRKYKAIHVVPIGDEFVVGVNNFMRKRWHHHNAGA